MPIPFPFDPGSKPDSCGNAYCLALAARAAYKREPELGSLITETWKLADYHPFDDGLSQGFLANGAGFSVLAFRGSDQDSIGDWISNADFDLVYDPEIRGGQVHKGFQRSSKSIWPQIEALIADYLPAGNQLYFTGHSLGGAMAVITAARFAAADREDEVSAIVTFGKPRAGDGGFARRFDRDFGDRIYRFVNRYDLITRLPPRLLGYEHVGQLRYIDEDGVVHESLSLWQRLLMMLDPRGKNAEEYIAELTNKLPGALSDHNSTRYIEALQKYC